MKLSLIYLASLLFLTQSIFGQKDIKELLKDSKFRYYSIEDTTSLSTFKDSIRFIISGDIIKPTIFFIQGSSSAPLLIESEGELYYGLVDVAPDEVYQDYNIVMISKPGVPVITEQNYILSSKEKEIFDHCNVKEYYISTLKQVYNYLKKEKLISESNNYLFGHSQGYGIVAKYAVIYPNDFSKIICASSSIYNVPAIKVNQAINKPYTQIEEKEQIEMIYKNFEDMYTLSKDTGRKYHLYYKKDISFWKDLTIDYLLRIQKPLLVVYGMDDPDALDNRILPIIFINKHKMNLSVLAYPDYDHNFNKLIISENEKRNKEYHWHDVFKDIRDWIEQ